MAQCKLLFCVKKSFIDEDSIKRYPGENSNPYCVVWYTHTGTVNIYTYIYIYIYIYMCIYIYPISYVYIYISKIRDIYI